MAQDSNSQALPEPLRPQPTGRLLVRLQPGTSIKAANKAFSNAMGVRAVGIRELGGAAAALSDAANADTAIVIEDFNVAIMPASKGENAAARVSSLKALDGVTDARQEFFLFAISTLNQRYSAWVREGLQILSEGGPLISAAGGAAMMERAIAAEKYADTDAFTWGLLAVGADRTRYTGRGIRVAVLDTGFDGEHPDFDGRAVTSQSFVGGSTQDVQGHGTHCAGTVLGPRQPTTGRRYGVAPEAELYVGKVLDDSGSGREGDILLGMRWAIQQKCAVISMSLGRPTFPGEKPDPLYEEVGTAALAAGSLIVAAAGNESRRELGYIAPVGAPANAKSIMAVAAVDANMEMAYFSCGGVNGNGGEVNLAAPGVAVYSSAPQPRLTRTLDGTSMACPHVAGIAALWAESDRTLRGQALKDAVEGSCRKLNWPARDVGKGLVQAPDGGGLVA
jgi:subtilisin family serine protease